MEEGGRGKRTVHAAIYNCSVDKRGKKKRQIVVERSIRHDDQAV